MDAFSDETDETWSVRLTRELDERRAAGESLQPVKLKSNRDLSTTFWGQAWNKNLMAYSHYELRMPAGRTLLRQGKILDLSVASGRITCLAVDRKICEVTVLIKPIDPESWRELRENCREQVASLADLLLGKMSDDLLRKITDPEGGLFPTPSEIRCRCTCPDEADVCKHSAGALYGFGAMLDEAPELFFTLRGTAVGDLLGSAGEAVHALTTPDPGLEPPLSGQNLHALFGLDLDDG